MNRRRGYTILEVLVALAILLVALVPLVGHLMGAGSSGNARKRLLATMSCGDRLSQAMAPGAGIERARLLESYPRCEAPGGRHER